MIAVLKELSTDEAALLNWFYMEVTRRQTVHPGMSIELTFREVVNGYKEVTQVSATRSGFNVCLSILEAANLIGKLDVNNEFRKRHVQTVRGKEAF